MDKVGIMKKRYLECNCGSADHLIRFGWFTDEKDPDSQYLYIEVQTNEYRGFFRRLLEAFKFVFNFGRLTWAESILFVPEAEELRDIIDEYLKEQESINASLSKDGADDMLDMLKQYTATKKELDTLRRRCVELEKKIETNK